MEVRFNEILEDLKTTNIYLYNNPELGKEEFKAKEVHTNLLKKYGFTIEENICSLPTAFKARYTGSKKGPTIALLAEYDALPDIGHGCGHNLLGVTSVGAGILLKDYVDEFGGTILVVGTPAEETDGGKVEMSAIGVFDEVDVAMIVHPKSGDYHIRSTTSQAMEALEFTFKGKTAHAATSPHLGINALDGVIALYNNINMMRQQILPTDRVHGIITNGGEAPNIIPGLAVANFYVRSRTKQELEVLHEKVINCAKGAAMASGTELEIRNYETSFLNLVTNKKLMSIYEESLSEMGITELKDAEGSGSTDAGDVSQVCPTIHPYFPIYKEATSHSIGFACACIEEGAYKGMKEAMFALVKTGKKILENNDLIKEIKEEFKASV